MMRLLHGVRRSPGDTLDRVDGPPDGPEASAPLVRDVLHIAEEMTARLDELARVTSRALACEVSRSAIVRAAMIAWLEGAERRPADVVVMQALRASAQRSAARLRRYPQRWPEELAVRLDRFARMASGALACKVSRSAVVRVAVAVWLDAATASPDVVSQAIRAALVSRGRRATSGLGRVTPPPPRARAAGDRRRSPYHPRDNGSSPREDGSGYKPPSPGCT